MNGSRLGSLVLLYLRALRVHQWLKNLLLFVPLIAAHRVGEGALLMQGLLGFVCFSGVASAVYLFNDWVDLDNDRHHPTKRYRPLASGQLPLTRGMRLIPVLLCPAFIVGGWLSEPLFAVLTGYCLLNVAYSLWLKRIPILDVIVLTSFYVGRVLAGAAVMAIWPSFWLLAFSLFLFLSLALVKRCSTLLDSPGEGLAVVRGYGYQPSDVNLLQSCGIASGYLSVLVLAMYIHSPEVLTLYRHPSVLWPLCLVLLFWISWIWLKANRGVVQGDPLVFALKDPVSYGLAAASAVILWVATG